MILKNPHWLMPRMGYEWMHTHLTQPEQQQLLTVLSSCNSNYDLHTLQAIVPTSMLQMLQNNADKADQNDIESYKTLIEKVSSFCNDVM